LAFFEYRFADQLLRQLARAELRFAAWCVPSTLSSWVYQVESTRVFKLMVKVGKARNRVGNQIANTVVIFNRPQPINWFCPECSIGNTGNNRWF
ncbi:hypothetical protein D021_0788B, partial [Vibrio parahaemolyticus 10296]